MEDDIVVVMPLHYSAVPLNSLTSYSSKDLNKIGLIIMLGQ